MSTINKNYTGSAHSHRWVSADLLFRDEPEDEEEEEEEDEEDDDGEHDDEDEDSGYSEWLRCLPGASIGILGNLLPVNEAVGIFNHDDFIIFQHR
jgi:hypothetical protein